MTKHVLEFELPDKENYFVISTPCPKCGFPFLLASIIEDGADIGLGETQQGHTCSIYCSSDAQCYSSWEGSAERHMSVANCIEDALRNLAISVGYEAPKKDESDG